MNKNEQGRAVEQVRESLRYYQSQKRAHSDPHNPLRAMPGHEAAFQAASEGVHDTELILKILENSARRGRIERARIFIEDVLETLLYLFLTIGWVGGALVGMACLCLTLRWNFLMTYAAMLGMALIWETLNRILKHRK